MVREDVLARNILDFKTNTILAWRVANEKYHKKHMEKQGPTRTRPRSRLSPKKINQDKTKGVRTLYGFFGKRRRKMSWPVQNGLGDKKKRKRRKDERERSKKQEAHARVIEKEPRFYLPFVSHRKKGGGGGIVEGRRSMAGCVVGICSWPEWNMVKFMKEKKTLNVDRHSKREERTNGISCIYICCSCVYHVAFWT